MFRFPRVMQQMILPLLLFSSSGLSHAGSSLPPEYKPHAELMAELEALAAESDWVTLKSLGKTREGRSIPLLVLGSEEPDTNPGMLILGSVQADSLVGCRMTVMMAQQLAAKAGNSDDDDDDNEASKAIRQLLKTTTLYIVPRPGPDASERLFGTPRQSTALNTRPTDDDNDGQTDEDAPEDLDGDGWITQMRIADPTGEYLLHPDDDRILVMADPAKGERGIYRMLSEGIDNDGDEAFNEDPRGGVDLNRNFTFQYPYFKPGAGPHQVSEPETRALANFAYDRLNVFAVFSFAPQQNLGKAWAAGSSGRIRTKVQADDKANYEAFAKLYKELVGNKAMPAATDRGGSVAPWAYFHLGRWSLATPGWWQGQPTAAAKEEEESSEDIDKKQDGEKPTEEPTAEGESQEEDVASDTGDKDSDSDSEKSDSEANKDAEPDKAKPDKRAQDQRDTLAWFEKHAIDGFSPWTEVEHPDFPGQKVEVGGIRQMLAAHPPVDALKIDEHIAFLEAICERQPMLEIAKTKVEHRGGGVYAVEVEVLNVGRLPLMSAMGEQSRQLQRVMIELAPEEGSGSEIEWLSGSPRQDLGNMKPGESKTRSWLLRGSPQKGAFTCRISSPAIRDCEATLSVEKTAEKQTEPSQQAPSKELSTPKEGK